VSPTFAYVALPHLKFGCLKLAAPQSAGGTEPAPEKHNVRLQQPGERHSARHEVKSA
jgi:hypothetical protein